MKTFLKKHRHLIFRLFIYAAFVLIATNNRLFVREYEIKSEKLSAEIKIAQISDLHSYLYGENQSQLLSAVSGADIVVLTGDIIDDDRAPRGNADILLSALAQKYPCYYVSGNHEYYTGHCDELKTYVAGFGITVLEGGCETAEVRGQRINICGVDDANAGWDELTEQLRTASEAADKNYFTMLLAHRPEYISDYLGFGFDLVLAGHAHGGQARLPGFINGFYAPNQGFFPEYAGGKYEFGQQMMIVSRGLSVQLPRVFNRPEVVLVTLKSA